MQYLIYRNYLRTFYKVKEAGKLISFTGNASTVVFQALLNNVTYNNS